MQEQQGIKFTSKQPRAEVTVAALKAIKSQPKKGDIMKEDGETPREVA